MTDKQRYLIVVGGPTASGKTALAIALAQHFNTAILSADSRQFYQGMAIGTAQPDAQELAAVPHYFIADRSVDTPLNAGSYADEALVLLDRLFEKHPVVVVCGGTGLYIRALIDGLDQFPSIPESYRDTLMEELQTKGLNTLAEELKEKDPEYAAQVDLYNPHRIVRALEVIRATASKYSSFLQHAPAARPFKSIQVAIELDRATLYDRINQRVDKMLAQGLEQEVLALQEHRHQNALQTVGYKEWTDFFENRISKEQLIEQIKQHSRNYAKRQITWFKRDPRVHWLNGASPEAAIAWCTAQINANELPK